jgi:hypothetical protein
MPSRVRWTPCNTAGRGTVARENDEASFSTAGEASAWEHDGDRLCPPRGTSYPRDDAGSAVGSYPWRPDSTCASSLHLRLGAARLVEIPTARATLQGNRASATLRRVLSLCCDASGRVENTYVSLHLQARALRFKTL